MGSATNVAISEPNLVFVRGSRDLPDRPLRCHILDYNHELGTPKSLRVEEEFEGFSLLLNLDQADKERALRILRRLTSQIEMELLRPTGEDLSI